MQRRVVFRQTTQNQNSRVGGRGFFSMSSSETTWQGRVISYSEIGEAQYSTFFVEKHVLPVVLSPQ